MSRSWFLLAWPLSVLACLALWWVPSDGPGFAATGDVYRGWPLGYGVDQRALSGDGYAFFATRFQPVPFVIDALCAVFVTMLVMAVCSMVARWMRPKRLET